MKYSSVGNDKPLHFILGLNVLENLEQTLEVASIINEQALKYNIPFTFKASFDKANRSSFRSYRGVDIEIGVSIFDALKEKLGCSILTDVHEPYQVDIIKGCVDVLQLPAFLARQTDLVAALARSGKIVNIKKPQFMSPEQTVHLINKFKELGSSDLLLCERGVLHGYDNLIVDFLGFRTMKELNGDVPLIFDVTHSLQTRSGTQAASGGRGRQLVDLALAGIVQRIAGVFVEVHPNPEKALCDGPSALKLDRLPEIIEVFLELDCFIKGRPELILER